MKNKIYLFFIFLSFLFSVSPYTCFAANEIEYQLYKNYENFGILVFPKHTFYAELESYIKSIDFELVESGKAVMRFGSKKENSTYMMPQEVQKKHSIEKFIITQVMPDHSLMIGIYDPEWGLTLPNAQYSLKDVEKNIEKTLSIFRGKNKKREILGELN